MDRDLQNLIFQAIDQTISEADFERLQDAMERDDELRKQYVRAVGLCESLAEIASEVGTHDAKLLMETLPTRSRSAGSDSGWGRWVRQFTIAATLLCAVSALGYWAGRHGMSLAEQAAPNPRADVDSSEALMAGHATLRRAVDVRWAAGATPKRQGDVLPHGRLEFEQGVMEIDFFCGAALIVEGPAALDLESDWSVHVLRGRLRANVPPAARGFLVKAAGSEIIDLGTEFALNVDADDARVEVIDGEVALRGGEHDGKHLFTGQGESLRGTQESEILEGLSTGVELQRRRDDAESQRLAQWKSHSQTLREDPRLIAYYPIADSRSARLVKNVSSAGSDRDGLMVGPVERVAGRFGSASHGFGFDRPGSRVRTRIDGSFEAFTFVCWVRIDSLKHRYNALFMGDSYENGEPHWQIRDDGRLMFSIMVDDEQEFRHFSKIDQKMVTQPGLHHIYFSDPIWDVTQSGQWFHLVAVYDPKGRQVDQYVNGKLVASEVIQDEFYRQELHIGPAEIGNWGQPFRKTPWFAVRNFNGAIDELAIFDAPLSSDEVFQLYEKGKPLGY